MWKCIIVSENFMGRPFTLTMVHDFKVTNNEQLALCSDVAGPKISFPFKGWSTTVPLKLSDNLMHRSSIKEKKNTELVISSSITHRGKAFSTTTTKKNNRPKCTAKTLEVVEILEVQVSAQI